MNSTVRKDILQILSKLISLLERGERVDSSKVRLLSNQVIHDASIYQDPDSSSVAVIVYAMSKVIERGLGFDGDFLKTVRSAYNKLLDKNINLYRKRITYLFKAVARKDHKVGMYIEKVLRYAQLKKGIKIYDHGISLARVSELLGISQWELSNYLGSTRISEAPLGRVNIAKRLSVARRIFEVKV